MTSFYLQSFFNWDSWRYIHQEFLKRTTPGKGHAHLLSLHYFIYLLFLLKLQNVTSLSFLTFPDQHMQPGDTHAAIKTFYLGFLFFKKRKLPSSYEDYPNQVDECKCEQQGRILWSSFSSGYCIYHPRWPIGAPSSVCTIFFIFCFLLFIVSLLFYLCYCQSAWQCI